MLWLKMYKSGDFVKTDKLGFAHLIEQNNVILRDSTYIIKAWSAYLIKPKIKTIIIESSFRLATDEEKLELL